MGAGLRQHADGDEHHADGEPDYSVDLLFTHEGCSVYRFEDRGHGVYYVDCGHSATTSQTLGCGRGCLRQETVQTTAGDEAPRTPTTTP